MKLKKLLSLTLAFLLTLGAFQLNSVNAADFVDSYNKLKNDYADFVNAVGVTDNQMIAFLTELEQTVKQGGDLTQSNFNSRMFSALPGVLNNHPAVFEGVINQLTAEEIAALARGQVPSSLAPLSNAVKESLLGTDTQTGGSSGGGGGGGAQTPKAEEKIEEEVEEEVEEVEEVEEQPAPQEEAPQTETFQDVVGHWGEKYITPLVATGAIKGYPDGSFRPNANITRAEFATVLVKAFDLEMKGDKVFDDTQNHWAKDFVAAAQAHGIISGYDDTTFGANDLITREQMAVMIVKTAKLEAVAGNSTFIDSSNISEWAVAAVEAAAANSIISGYQDQTFKPKANATRAEAVTVIVKALEK
ncbi:S-layer homology domain-containing protein [Clostridium formicaceticum]|uniref:Endoglucanase n=1 Tax=Clostridium formicaceticum TaxID=1497 RepID=A0AAC9RFT9_9CLOT|nr:S-layer homology domain-containing protein [Clostridium formicaceticum]AOY75628.1 hypothetical protein BJL90_06810 [Clostridium formicaceticum]ARE85939.1 Endoglucanase precursor [Clostridium formicaceticum]